MSARGACGPLGSKAAARTATAQPGGVRRLGPDDVVLDRADAIVIGGGVTGVGVLWDLTLRGLDVVLVEQASIGRGTSGAFHGLLHSGARYAVTDPATAAECLRENRVLRAVAGRFIEDTGGLFVRGPEDDPAWEAAWLDACRRAGLSPRRLTPGETLRREPGLRRDLVSAFAVPDATIDGFRLLWSLVWAAVEAGARVYLGARVVDYLTDEAGVRGVRVAGVGQAPGPRYGRTRPVEPGEIVAPVVVNATGPWARETAALAGPEAGGAVPVQKDKGVLVTFNARVVSAVLQRLRPPADGDILVPHGPVTIAGTTSTPLGEGEDGNDRLEVSPQEVAVVVREAMRLVPTLDRVPPLRAFAGRRPLVLGSPSPEGHRPGGRGAGRGFILVDHASTGGPAGLVTLAGGKFTTFRAMAEAAGDVVTRLLGRKAPCRTREVGIPRPPERPRDLSGALACGCELVAADYFEGLLDTGLDLVDAARVSRIGLGGCQATFCVPRLAGVMWSIGWPGSRRRPRADATAISGETEAFRQERLAGVRTVAWGAQARLVVLAEALDRLTVGPGPGRADRAHRGGEHGT